MEWYCQFPSEIYIFDSLCVAKTKQVCWSWATLLWQKQDMEKGKRGKRLDCSWVALCEWRNSPCSVRPSPSHLFYRYHMTSSLLHSLVLQNNFVEGESLKRKHYMKMYTERTKKLPREMPPHSMMFCHVPQYYVMFHHVFSCSVMFCHDYKYTRLSKCWFSCAVRIYCVKTVRKIVRQKTPKKYKTLKKYRFVLKYLQKHKNCQLFV